MTTLNPIKRQTVTSAVTDLIRARIIAGDYPGGFQIRQEQIAKECGVSRIPVREALVQLEAEGLVHIHTHRGALVAVLNEQDAIDIFEARLLLEPHLIATAIRNAKPVHREAVRQALDDYRAELRQAADPARLSALNWAFHKALTQPAARPRTLAILQSLYHGADRYLRLQIDETSAQARALEDHMALAEAFCAGQPSQARALLKQHITDAHRDVIKGLRLRSKQARNAAEG